MRIHTILGVNTHPQQNPFNTQSAGALSPGKTASGKSFDDFLKPYFQQASSPVITQQMEHQIVGILWGCFPSMRESPKTEPKLEANAN